MFATATRGDKMHHSIADNIHLGLAVGYIGSVLAGINWTAAAAAAALVYSVLLIAEKLYRWYSLHRAGKSNAVDTDNESR